MSDESLTPEAQAAELPAIDSAPQPARGAAPGDPSPDDAAVGTVATAGDATPADAATPSAADLSQRAATGGPAETAAGGEALSLPELRPATRGSTEIRNSIDLLDDVELNVKIELGRTEMDVEDVLRLDVGSVVELEKLAGDPVDIYANERLVARGEVLVLNDNFCVRVNEILSPAPDAEGAR